MLSVLHRAARRLPGRADRRADPQPQEATPVDAGNQLLFDAIKREFPFMSDDCIWQVISEM